MVKEKNPAAVALGRLGGKVGGKVRMAKLSVAQHAELSAKGGRAGGKARAKKLTSERRSEIARKAAATRWAKRNGGSDSLS